jgi:hypothetical protein
VEEIVHRKTAFDSCSGGKGKTINTKGSHGHCARPAGLGPSSGLYRYQGVADKNVGNVVYIDGNLSVIKSIRIEIILRKI